jgi:DNA mismatch repair protein MutL
VLSRGVIEKIAAGETIERPVSVLKELVENALDAGATSVTIRVDGSLDRSLRVVDDGVGMTAGELALAVCRHATSKVREADDLFRLATLGFRGEALPSIAAVSALTITSCADEGGSGSEIEVVGGEVIGTRPAARRRGTTVHVRDLFFNVPARRKFMKTERGELRVAARLVSHIALAYPHVRFAFERNDAAPHLYESVAELRARAGDVYGRTTADVMLDVRREKGGVEVVGLVGRPEHSRATREYQVIVVNGRPVVSPLISHAVKTGFGDLIPPDRQPTAVLHLRLDPALVDANVHPTKREVKFAHEGAVFESVREGVKEALGHLSSSILPIRRTGAPEPAPSDDAPGRPAEILELWAPPRGDTPVGAPPGPPAESVGAPHEAARPDEPKFWQLHKRYIFAQTSSGVLVIDQHAAHERILYERALERLDGAATTAQRLLFPEPMELTPAEDELLGELVEELGKLGFEIERFGGRSIIVRAIPDDVYGWDRGQLLRDMLDEYVSAGRSVRAVRERLARSFACRGAIKSGMAMSAREMHALIDALFATSTPHGDPHGRPTFLRMSLDDLDTSIGRG